MRIIPLLTALLAFTAFSATMQSCAISTKSITSTYCVPAPRRLTLTTILPRMQRPRPDEVSLSPPVLPAPRTSTSNNVAKDNSSTSSVPHGMPSAPAWLLTVEDLITALFRIVITILTLFNVNITWRIRANQDRRPRELRNAWAGVRFEVV